jgi:hypothetical protein
MDSYKTPSFALRVWDPMGIIVCVYWIHQHQNSWHGDINK